MATLDTIVEKMIDKITTEKIAKALSEQNEKDSAYANLNRKIVYNNKELSELFNVDPKTIKKYRDRGLLAYTQHGDKYFYTEEDIKEFLNHNHYSAFAYTN